MSLFLITFLSLYGALHAYAFVRVRTAFSLGRSATMVMAGWMAFGITAPLLVRLAEHAGHERAAAAMAWPGYIWMGCLFIFVSLLLAFDILCGAVWVFQKLTGRGISLTPSLRITCEIALLVTVAASVYSLFEARHLRVEQVTIPTVKLPSTIPTLRIVQISDVHIGLLFREARLSNIIKTIQEAQPDILVSTGDLVDGRLCREDVLEHQNGMAALLAAVTPAYGAYAVTGNHDFYAGLDQALAFTSTSGFKVLRNETIILPQGISITGVDDPAGKRMGLPVAKPAESELLNSASSTKFRLFLKHRPVLQPESDGQFDLQLSGHVHKGQIFPFNLLVRLQYPIPCGTTVTRAGSLIHVSRGTGTWGPPMRLFAPPEITIIDLVRKK